EGYSTKHKYQFNGRILMRRIRTGLLVSAAIAVVVLFIGSKRFAGAEVPPPTTAQGLAAWDQVYSVLTSPRCINCQPPTNYPQQADDRHRHVANVVRGPEGKGVPGLNCAGCHQETNADSTGVPGGHNWHLAPLSMRWQDTNDRVLSSAEVCRAVTDRSRNNNLDGPGLLKHHEEEPLVKWAWNPGRRPDGTARTLPPLTHEQFIAATRRWVEAGTPCPKKELKMASYRLNINGQIREVTVDPSTPLLWVLREDLKMTGTKYGCGVSACGACTVHVAGVATRSCIVPISFIGDRPVETIEAMADDH